MEQQSQDTSTPPPAVEAASTAPARPRSTTSTSVPTLRFPKPLGSRHLANWISSSSPDIMSPSGNSEESAMADSAFELIHSTDGESQDERMNGSVSDLDFARNDDIQSIHSSDRGTQSDSDEDDDEDDHRSASSAIRHAEQVLQNPSSRSPSATLQFGSPANHIKQAIEFLEGDPDNGTVVLDKISVKHTIRDFTEEETATIVRDMHMDGTPKRLVATVRQTMSLNCLFTREPLRILYVGSADRQMDILYKISSAICASGRTEQDGKSHMFNIFPISEFGSDELPDIQLLESPAHQIRVEECTRAEEIEIEGGSFPGDTVYSVTVNDDKTYKSLFTPSGSVIQPRWSTLPHIAIFFCTERDDEQTKYTRGCAWEFMKRHGIPYIFISNTQSFSKPPTECWKDFVDQHAVHLCLESRDLERPTHSQRLPIDLISFLKIDARQMNRNLAYLTGLAGPSDLAYQPGESSTSTILCEELSKKRLHTWEAQTALCHARAAVREYFEQNPWLFSLLMTILGGVLAIIIAAMPWSGARVADHPAPFSTASSAIVTTTTVTAQTRAPTVSTTTVIVNVTATKTVKIRQTRATASTLASVMSFAGFLSDKASTAVPVPEPQKNDCTVEVYRGHEILVRLPSVSKTLWLAKGAIDIDVYSGEKRLKTKLSSVDEGIVVELDKSDAYGVLNVSVITTRKPKINQTFEVNFGKPAVVEVYEMGMHMLQNLAGKMAATGDDASQVLEDTVMGSAQKLREDVNMVLDRLRGAGEAATAYSKTLGEDAVARARDTLDRDNIAKHAAYAQQQIADYLPASVDQIRDDIRLVVLRAQIASRLWWLKLQGQMDEYTEYERNASKLYKATHDFISRERKAREREATASGSGRRARRCTANKKKGREAGWNKKGRRGSRWTRIIG